MKNFVKITSVIFFLVGIQIAVMGNNGDPVEKEKNIKVSAIETSAKCQDCKDRIEYELIFTKGVVSADFDAMTGKLLIKYKSKKIGADEIREIISGMGYDADHVKADKAAFKVLPKTCKAIIGG